MLAIGQTRQRPALRPGETWGIDVSHHQGEIDWTQVARDGVTQAYVKASEGKTLQDDHFAANWAGARAAGLRAGAYHFFSLCRTGDEQATNFLDALRAAGATTGGLPPVVDLEFGGNCSGRPGVSELDHELDTFLKRIEAATGQRAMLYVFDDFERAYPLTAYGDRTRWVRSIGPRPTGAWGWWQVDDNAAVAGVARGVDLDVVSAG